MATYSENSKTKLSELEYPTGNKKKPPEEYSAHF